MRVSLAWLREFVDIPEAMTPRDIAAQLIRLGFEVESVEIPGADIAGPIVVGRIVSIEELTEFKKPIRYCQVDVGPASGRVRGIVCGARNFHEGDLVVAALPGAVLPGGFEIAARETYGRTSDGMLCSARELGLGDDHTGIIVLTEGDSDVGRDAMPVLGLADAVLDVSVNPDRGYAMSVRGLARELAGALAASFADPCVPSDGAGELSGMGVVADPSFTPVVDVAACTSFVALELVGADSSAVTPRWMQNRLIAAGMRPAGPAVDITNYVMLETGQPMHAYDARRVTGRLRVRYATEGEPLETLDHQVRALSASDLVIADDAKVLGLAGIMGGVDSEIAHDTTSMIVETAHFDADAVAASCRRHHLSTEASRRFERGVDPAITRIAAAKAARLFAEIMGARIGRGGAVGGDAPSQAFEVSAQAVISRTGLTVDVAQLVGVLRGIGCEVSAQGDLVTVAPPTWRPDLTAACDLSEELARVVGYANIAPIYPAFSGSASLTAMQRLRRRVDDLLADLGWVQVMTSPFAATDQFAGWNLQPDDVRLPLVRIANPLSDEQPFMRSSLLPSLFEAVGRNRARGFDACALFERSEVHSQSGTREPGQPQSPPAAAPPSAGQLRAMQEVLPTARVNVGGAAFGEHTAAGVFGKGRRWEWSDAVDAALSVCAARGVRAWAEPGATPPWHPGRCARIMVAFDAGAAEIGYAGEVHPRVIEAHGGPAGLIAFEIDVTALAGRVDVAKPYFGEPLATSAVVKEDVALVVPTHVTAAAVERELREGCGPWLEDVRLFDRYSGDQVPAGHVSLAFNLRFRNPERTLRDDEVAELRQQGIERAQAMLGAVLRGSGP